MDEAPIVRELRIALAVDDFDEARAFYGDTLGLPVMKEWHTGEGSGAVFTVRQGTLEVVDATEAAAIDLAEVGRVVGKRVRLGMRVDDVDRADEMVKAAGATPMGGGPVDTPWGGRNARVRTPDGTQLTLFHDSEED